MALRTVAVRLLIVVTQGLGIFFILFEIPVNENGADNVQ